MDSDSTCGGESTSELPNSCIAPDRAGAKSLAATTNVGGFDYIPPQERRSVDAEADLEFDTSAGPHRGRLYLAYTDEDPDESNDTDIMLRFSDDQGASWSAITQLNDDPSRSSQFFPKMSVDPTTGNVGAIWSECRRDLGRGSATDTDGRANTDVEIWGTVIAVPQTVPVSAHGDLIVAPDRFHSEVC